MTSRERVRRALRFEGVDHIPHFLPDHEPNDIEWIWLERPADRKPWTVEGTHQVRVDAWGVTWSRTSEETFGEATSWPFADIERSAERPFPPMNDERFFGAARERVSKNNESENPKYCLGVMPFSSLNEGTHNIMGLTNMFLAYYEHPDSLKRLVGRLADGQAESIRKLAEAGCDGVMGYDDWGLQDRLMVGRDLIEEFFMPHYRRNWALAHSLGMDVWLHSCGYIIELLPQFIEAGLDVVQMDQQENMGLERLDEVAGGRLAFWCPVDIQKTMIEGSIADIEAYVERMTRTVGNHSGGLISMAYSTPEAVHHTSEKIAAMCRAFRRIGVYGG
jgi:uroporphyrinogen decarboxylase